MCLKVAARLSLLALGLGLLLHVPEPADATPNRGWRILKGSCCNVLRGTKVGITTPSTGFTNPAGYLQLRQTGVQMIVTPLSTAKGLQSGFGQDNGNNLDGTCDLKSGSQFGQYWEVAYTASDYDCGLWGYLTTASPPAAYAVIRKAATTSDWRAFAGGVGAPQWFDLFYDFIPQTGSQWDSIFAGGEGNRFSAPATNFSGTACLGCGGAGFEWSRTNQVGGGNYTVIQSSSYILEDGIWNLGNLGPGDPIWEATH